jgi:hypothetical protein
VGMKHVLRLPALLALLAGPVAAQVPGQPAQSSATVAFGSVTASYTNFLTGGLNWTFLDILNNTDKDVRCTMNAGTNSFLIPAYSSFSPKLGEVRQFETRTIQCKHDGVAPTVGNVELYAQYLG